MKKTKEAGGQVSSKSACYLSALALKMNDPGVALEALSLNISVPFASRNLKILALCELGRPEDAMLAMRATLNMNDVPNKRRELLTEVVNKVEEHVRLLNDKEVTSDFTNILRALKENNLLKNDTMESLLDVVIEDRPNRPQNGSPGGLQQQLYRNQPDGNNNNNNNRFAYDRSDPDFNRRRNYNQNNSSNQRFNYNGQKNDYAVNTRRTRRPGQYEYNERSGQIPDRIGLNDES